MAANLPAAIEEVVERVEALGMPGVSVFDGQPFGDITPEVVAIGLTAEEVGVEGTERQRGMRVREKRFDLMCMVGVGTGDTDIRPVRARAFEIYHAVRGALSADEQLGGTVTYSSITSTSYEPTRSADGVIAEIAFVLRLVFLS